MTQSPTEAPKVAWPVILISRLRKIIRTHENSSVRLVIATHVIMVVLDLFDRATFQSVTIEYRMLEIWSESPLWIILGLVCIAWLMIWRHPPRLIWGLWLSTAVLSGWGLTNMSVAFVASHPVSLLGPSLILGLAAPLAWTTAEALQERMQQDENIAHHDAEVLKRPEEG